MATRSVREHPGRFLIAIMEGFIDKLLSEKTTVAMQACWWDQGCIYLTISQKGGHVSLCYPTLLNLLVSGIERQNGLFSVWGFGNHGPVYISLKSGLLACKCFTMGRGEAVVPLKGRLQGCLCFQEHLWVFTEAHRTQKKNLFKRLSTWVCHLP